MIHFHSILTGVAKFHSTFFWIYPFILLKSLLVCCGIINNANLMPLVNHPPTSISMFIKKTPKHLLTQIFAANTKYFTPYWIGGPKNISYVGSSMHLFQNLKFSTASRISQHIRHADLHRQGIPHKCKQPLL